MPRLVHKPPTYAHHKPSGRARVRYRGVDHYLPGPYGSPESLKAYAELIARLTSPDGAREATEPTKAPEGPAPNLLTIAELIERFWEHAQDYYRRDGQPTGEHQVIRAALRPLLHMFARTLATEFKPRNLKLVRDEMIRLNWSRRYINSSVGRIKRMFNWAVEEELIPPEVAGALARVRGLQKNRTGAREKPKVEAVPDEVVEATLPHVSPVVRDLIQVMRLSGARPGEARTITVEAIDRSDPTCWEYKPEHHKTEHHGKDRIIFIGPRCQAILGPRVLKAGSGRVFPISKSGVKKAIEKACDRVFRHPTLAEIPESELTEAQGAELKAWRKAHRWHPNQLRHSAATEIRKRFGIEGAQVVLGHARAATTEIYAEVNSDRGREVARAVG
jgi:integrase